MTISHEQAVMRMAEAIQEYVGLYGRIRMLEEAFFRSENAELAEPIAEAWRVARIELAAAKRSVDGIERVFDMMHGTVTELVTRLDVNMAPTLQRRAS